MAEKKVLGLFLTGHPMEVFEGDVERYSRVPISKLGALESGQEVRVVGLPSQVQTIRTRRGDRMAFCQLEGAYGSVEVVFFSKTWGGSQRVIATGMPVLLTGVLENGDEGCKVKAQSVELLSEVRARLSREAVISLTEDDLVDTKIQSKKIY